MDTVQGEILGRKYKIGLSILKNILHSLIDKTEICTIDAE